MSELQQRIRFHQSWLTIEDQGIASLYSDLLRAVRDQVGHNMRSAWEAAAVTDDAGMNLHLDAPLWDEDRSSVRPSCIYQRLGVIWLGGKSGRS